MRFVSRGPTLPDELLTARDAGRVLFFCGAGVSQAEAGLPNFGTLAEKVLTQLGSALDSPARRLFNASQSFEKASGLTGLVATDRIFGMLEQEFEPAEVREEVAIALQPVAGYGLGAHRALLDLSRTQSGVARLVTTNFDRLFEECDPALDSFNPPHLPDPRRESDFRGIVHLHGRVDPGYRRACDDEFVLSSADFGRAYLSDGWATRYIQALLERFTIVFVGYSADDPPVQYLLEALSRSGDRHDELYAFQAGDIAQASEQWEHKGVHPIAYHSAGKHAALWDTLRAWAGRARDVDGWHRRLIASAVAGPEGFQPFERGMVAHLAATSVGARHLMTATDVLPPSWLFVFDPQKRYGQAGHVNFHDKASPRFDPFDAFGLDSDEPPAPTGPEELFERSIPDDAWDAFTSTAADRSQLPPTGAGQLRGRDANLAATLPPRLLQLGMYLIRIAHHPATLWWAAHQSRLHPDLQQHLEGLLRQESARFPAIIRDGWRALLAAWQQARTDADQTRYEIEAQVKIEGWSPTHVREVIAVYRPVLEVKPAFGVKAPADCTDLQLKNILCIDVDYPRPLDGLPIPPEHLAYAVPLFRQQIDHGIALERETRGRDSIDFDTTRADDGKQPDENALGLTGHLNTYTNMIVRLAAADQASARAQVMGWPADNNEVFTRLRIWAAGRADLLTPAEAADIFLSLDERSFWTDQHQRDLLYALRDRWAQLPPNQRARIEARLLEGHFPWPKPRDDEDVINAHYRLNRLQWLRGQGALFSFDIDVKMAGLCLIAPGWEIRYGDEAARPNVSEAYSIVTDDDPKSLLDIPLCEVLDADREAGGRDFFSRTERQPFRGLAETHPAKALGVLTDAARRGVFDVGAWATMLDSQAKATTSTRMLTAIAHRLARLSTAELAKLAHPVSRWLLDRAETLFASIPQVFDLVWDALTATLASHPTEKKFRRPDASWANDGLNRPAGRMVDAMFKDPSMAGFTTDSGLPDNWRRRFDKLLALPDDHRQHAIAMIMPWLNRLYDIDPGWTEAQLVAVADGKTNDAQAFWDGYFWGSRSPQLPLYRRLKPSFITQGRSGDRRRGHTLKLAGMLLAGWGGDEGSTGSGGLIDNVELREILIHGDDSLRTQMLQHIEHWTLEPGSPWGDRLVPFLRDVWPRQRSVRTPRVSGQMALVHSAGPG